MKLSVVLTTALFSLTVNAQETSITNMGEQTSVMQGSSGWNMQIGRSGYTGEFNEKASGLTVGAGYQINELYSVGAQYTNFKYDEADSGEGFDVLALQGQATPISYTNKKMEFGCSLLAGFAPNISRYDSKKQSFYYGAALTAKFNQQIGVSLDTKVSKDFNSINGLSLVGYY